MWKKRSIEGRKKEVRGSTKEDDLKYKHKAIRDDTCQGTHFKHHPQSQLKSFEGWAVIQLIHHAQFFLLAMRNYLMDTYVQVDYVSDLIKKMIV